MSIKSQELGTDVNLYALVFGESVLNDAVCITLLLFNTSCFFLFLLKCAYFFVSNYGLEIKVAISLYR